MVKYEINKERDRTIEDRLAAAANLSGAGFKLYCYLESFPWGASFYIQKDFANQMGLDARTASSAFSELIKENYLVAFSDSTYFFNENCRKF